MSRMGSDMHQSSVIIFAALLPMHAWLLMHAGSGILHVL